MLLCKKYINKRSLNALQPEQKVIAIIKDYVCKIIQHYSRNPIYDSKDQFVLFNEWSNACTPDYMNKKKNV